MGNSKKHPISGVWYTPIEKVLKAELCFKFVLNGYILWEQGEKNDFVFGKKFRDAESVADFGTLRGQKCCVIKFLPIYMVIYRLVQKSILRCGHVDFSEGNTGK